MSNAKPQPSRSRWTVRDCAYGETLPLMDGVTICPADGAVNLTIENLHPETGQVLMATSLWLSPNDALNMASSLKTAAKRGRGTK